MSVRLGLDRLHDAVSHPRLSGVQIMRAFAADDGTEPELQLRLEDWQKIFPTNPPHHYTPGWAHYESVIDGVRYTSCTETETCVQAALAIGALQAAPHSSEAILGAAAALGEGDASWEGE